MSGKTRGLITGMGLKRIAAATMLIDHIGATLVEKYIVNELHVTNVFGIVMGMETADPFTDKMCLIYLLMRAIGRIAFPIYAFLVVEGFMHTRSLGKYIRNLFLFALISEIPFDMAVRMRFLDSSYQNVNFTLLIGLFAIIGIDFFCNSGHFSKWPGVFCSLGWGALMMYLAELLRTDYGYIGVIGIIVMYVLRKKSTLSMGLGVIAISLFNYFEICAIVDIIPIALYNGKRGRGSKYFHYAFYPAHLFILGTIIMLIW